MTWLDRLEKARVEAVAQNVDLRQFRLERVRGKVDFDGVERVSTQTLLDLLQVPQRHRRVGTYRRLARRPPRDDANTNLTRIEAGDIAAYVSKLR
jgi:hypothetical protein